MKVTIKEYDKEGCLIKETITEGIEPLTFINSQPVYPQPPWIVTCNGKIVEPISNTVAIPYTTNK